MAKSTNLTLGEPECCGESAEKLRNGPTRRGALGGLASALAAPYAGLAGASAQQPALAAMGLGPKIADLSVAGTSDLALFGEQVIDGKLTSSSLVLLTGQVDASQNGLWRTASGAWKRYQSAKHIEGLLCIVLQGVGAGQWLLATTGEIILGRTPLEFVQVLSNAAQRMVTDDGGNVQQSIAIAADTNGLMALSTLLPEGITVRTNNGFQYTVAPSDATDHDLTTAGGAKLYVEPVSQGVWNIRSFGAIGNYDAAIEKPGEVAVAAHDNFDAIHAAARAFENRLLRGELVFPPGDYWASNMPRFRVSNFAIRVEAGAVIRTTTPTSFGTTVYLGEDYTENVKIYGGGAVRNFLPNPAAYSAWASGATYSPGTYIKNSKGHVYWTESGGTAGASEPTAVNGTISDGGVIWRDAFNDNGVSLHGNNASCIGIHIPEANNKGITCQLPPWRNVRIKNCIVGSTWFAGIEVKGNQGMPGQEALFGRHGYVTDNIVQDAGGHGINVEQPSAGRKKNRHITVRGNIVERAGYREGGQAGIRVNRCVAPVIAENKVLDAAGNGMHIRLCDDVTGDIYVEKFGMFGLHLQDCTGWDFTRTIIHQGGTANSDAIRESACEQSGHFGRVVVTGGGYENAFCSLARSAVVTADSLQLVAGRRGTVLGPSPLMGSGMIRDPANS